MQSSLIGKIEKANRYAQETDRVTFHELSVNFRGENRENSDVVAPPTSTTSPLK